MKKIIQIIIIITCFIVCLTLCSHIGTTYTRSATVIDVIEDLIVAKDSTGNIWKFKGTNFIIGDQIKLIMDNQLTDGSITDDIVRDATVFINN